MILFILGILFLYIIYTKLIRPCYYWKEKGVPHVKSWPLVGSLGEFVLRKAHFVDVFVDIYRKFPSERYVGCNDFTRPSLLLKDLSLIKQICVKDFHNFTDHYGMDTSVNVNSDDLLSRTLITLNGDEWRQMRATLSPAFTSSKMRAMYHLMDDCAVKFVHYFQGKRLGSMDVKEIFSAYTNDVIASTAFGIQTDSLNEPDNEFFTMGQTFYVKKPGQVLRSLVLMMAPWLAKMMNIQIIPTNVAAFFRSIIRETITKRETEGIIRPDLINLMMEAKKGRLKHETHKDDKDAGFATVEESHIAKTERPKLDLTDDDIVAQAMLFFFAGFQTASTASCFLAYELAVNPDVQKKLQQEIDRVSAEHDGKITYDALISMKYLDQTISETLRLWPPGIQTDRLCSKSYIIKPETPQEKVLVIEKGTNVVIPIYAIHRDPNYFPQPERFDPERFSDSNKPKIVPGSYLPFGLGPRNCIASRFALLELKTLFFHLLSKFKIVTVKDTPIPLKFDNKNMNLIPNGGFMLAFEPRAVNTSL